MAQHATSPDLPPPHWLALEAGGRHCLVPLAQAGEIFAWTAVQAVPHARPWFLGVANLRGELCGVVDLGRFLDGDLPGSEPAAPPEPRLLGLPPAMGLNCALRIDRLLGLHGADGFAPTASGRPDAPAWLGPQYNDAQGGAWLALDLQALARSPAFLAIDA
jgi:twitching motility protein PilI